MIQGTDQSSGFAWPVMVFNPNPALTGILGVITASDSEPAPEDINNYIRNTIETITGAAGKPTQALKLEVTKPSPSTCCTQNSLQMAHMTEDITDVYIRYWLKLNPEFQLQAQNYGEKFWRSIWQMKTRSDYRITTYIYGSAAGQPYWFVHADNAPVPNNSYKEFWSVSNKAVAVPMNDWFPVEIYLHRSADDSGRFFWGANGQTIADHYGPNIGALNEIVDGLMIINLYSSVAEPIYEWVDDLEIWNVPPCETLPCTVPPTISGGSPSGLLPATTTEVTMSVLTDVDATCRYSNTAGIMFSAMSNVFGATGGTEHSTVLSGLNTGATYTNYVRCADAGGMATAADYAVSFRIAGARVVRNPPPRQPIPRPRVPIPQQLSSRRGMDSSAVQR